MRLLIIGHTSHYRHGNKIFGWGPTVKEINMLSHHFDEITHLACIKNELVPKSALPYESNNVKTVLLPPAGGVSILDKIRLITLGPRYITKILGELITTDIVQIRAPGGLALYAVLISPFIKKPIWIKYGGNWDERGFLPPLRSFIRWWLKSGIVNKPITVNGRWPKQPDHVYSFYNPSFTCQEIEGIRKKVLGKRLSSPVRFLYAGRLESAKGVDKLISIFYDIRSSIDAHLDILGDGPLYDNLYKTCIELKIISYVTFHGWQPHRRVTELLENSHFILLPSLSEGWPKILSEGMAYGAVPIASDVSSIPQILRDTNAGIAIPINDLSKFKHVILDIINDKSKWKEMSLAGINASGFFTYEYYISSLDKMLFKAYGFSPFETEQLVLEKIWE